MISVNPFLSFTRNLLIDYNADYNAATDWAMRMHVMAEHIERVWINDSLVYLLLCIIQAEYSARNTETRRSVLPGGRN
jgi:hypothetical protein